MEQYLHQIFTDWCQEHVWAYSRDQGISVQYLLNQGGMGGSQEGLAPGVSRREYTQ